MRAMRLIQRGAPLRLDDIPTPKPAPGEARLRVLACGVCRTDLHIADGELAPQGLPRTLGHEIVGIVDEIGAGVSNLRRGMRVGVGWLGSACGACAYCRRDAENLCDAPAFTGYTRDGGFAEFAVADARYCYALPEAGEDAGLAPLLCAGLIGWRSLVMAGDGAALGLYGFGAAAHIILQVAKWQGRRVYVFTRAGDAVSQKFALELGADWAGAADETPPEPLDAAIIYAPAGPLVPLALKAVRKGGRVICAGIHMSDIPSFPYHLLWGERSIASVANLTRQDADDFLAVAARAPIKTQVTPYKLERANEALADLRAGRLQGAAVLTM